MTVRLYSSTDAGATAVNNTAGTLNNMMLACLVNGYSIGTVSSVVRSGSTVTVTLAAPHNMRSFGNWVTIAGAVQTEYNGVFAVNVPSTTTFTYTIAGTPASPATGTVTVRKDGAGWTRPFSGANLSAFQQGVGGNGHFLYVDDTGTAHARMVGYETMTSISDTTGNPFPTNTQVAGGTFMAKSNTTAVRAWLLIATPRAFHLWVDHIGSTISATSMFFGNFTSYRTSPPDAFNTAILTSASTTTTGIGAGMTTGAPGTVSTGAFVARGDQQTGGSVTCAKRANQASASQLGSGGGVYPDRLRGGMVVTQLFLETEGQPRGVVPGLLAPMHNMPLADFDFFTGTGPFAGRRYLAVRVHSGGQVFYEVSNTW